MLKFLAINSLKTTDIVFFIVLAVIVAVCVAFYFLIPVFNKKQYQEQRENLKKREKTFKANASIDANTTEQQPVSEPKESADKL